MKTTMSALLGLAMIAASAFAAQDAPKTATPKADTTAPAKVKKHKKAHKTTDAAKPAATTPAPVAK